MTRATRCNEKNKHKEDKGKTKKTAVVGVKDRKTNRIITAGAGDHEGKAGALLGSKAYDTAKSTPTRIRYTKPSRTTNQSSIP